MRIQYQDLRNKRRTPLRDAVPLDTPFLVQFDPANVCNLRCAFCPTGHREFRDMRHNGIMDYDVFEKIIADFRNMPHRVKQWTICKDGEPLINPRIVEMCSAIVEAGVADKVWLKTNGLMLSPAMNQDLADCGMNMIGVSIKQFSAEGYKRVTGVAVDYNRLMYNIADLYERCRSTNTALYVSTLNMNLTQAERDKFYTDFEKISDTCAIEDLHGWSMSEMKDLTFGNAAETTEITQKLACPWPLFAMGINWDGSVSACQEDWSMSNIIGDLKTQTVRDVWRGDARKAFLLAHLEGRRHELKACAQCSYVNYCPDNIDNDRGWMAEVYR